MISFNIEWYEFETRKLFCIQVPCFLILLPDELHFTAES